MPDKQEIVQEVLALMEDQARAWFENQISKFREEMKNDILYDLAKLRAKDLKSQAIGAVSAKVENRHDQLHRRAFPVEPNPTDSHGRLLDEESYQVIREYEEEGLHNQIVLMSRDGTHHFAKRSDFEIKLAHPEKPYGDYEAINGAIANELLLKLRTAEGVNERLAGVAAERDAKLQSAKSHISDLEEMNKKLLHHLKLANTWMEAAHDWMRDHMENISNELGTYKMFTEQDMDNVQTLVRQGAQAIEEAVNL